MSAHRVLGNNPQTEFKEEVAEKIEPLINPAENQAENEEAASHAQNISDILSDIENYKKLKDMVTQNKGAGNQGENLSFNTNLDKAVTTLRDINSLKDELCKLPLDPCEKDYIDNSIFPLLNTMYLISTVSINLSTSVNILTLSSIEHPKRSKLKDTINLVYDINEECECIYKVIKRRLKALLCD